MLSAIDLLDTLAFLLGFSRDFLDKVFWGALLAGLALATLHLLTMLVTRWGDRRATGKSLIFSVLVHVTLILLLLSMKPDQELVAQPSEKEEPIQIHKLLVEGMEKLETDGSGNTAVWDRIPVPIDVQLTRQDRLPSELKPLETPNRRPEPVISPEVDFPDVPSLLDPPSIPPASGGGRKGGTETGEPR